LLGESYSRKGSVASLSGLAQEPPVGREKAELPQDETDESEKEEQMEPERGKGGCSFWRLSLIMDHSLAGDSTGLVKARFMRGAGVLGGLTKRCTAGSGARRLSSDAVAWNIGLDSCDAASGISSSMLGMMVSAESDLGSASD